MFSRCEPFKHLLPRALLFFFFYPSKFEAIVFVQTPCQAGRFPRTDNISSRGRSRDDEAGCGTVSEHDEKLWDVSQWTDYINMNRWRGHRFDELFNPSFHSAAENGCIKRPLSTCRRKRRLTTRQVADKLCDLPTGLWFSLLPTI